MFLNSNPLAKIESGNVYYYHNDHLGTPQKITDSSGSTAWYGEFLPFGEPLSITGTITNNLRFPGQYYDEETGLHYNYFRDYKPMIGRYVEADPIGIFGARNHLYLYVGNNPVNYIDPDGLRRPSPEPPPGRDLLPGPPPKVPGAGDPPPGTKKCGYVMEQYCDLISCPWGRIEGLCFVKNTDNCHCLHWSYRKVFICNGEVYR